MGTMELMNVEVNSAAIWLLRAVGVFFLIALLGLVLSAVHSVKRSRLWKKLR